MMSLQPLNILKPGAEEEKAEIARMSAFIGALAVGDLVKTTLGPKGMDKILVSGDPTQPIHVTNDGATIMRAIGVDNPAAKVLVDISKTQDEEVGDGTTSVVVLTCELLRGAESLIAQKLHPQTIISGWRKAADVARKALLASAKEAKCDDATFKNILMKVARTTLSSKILKQDMEHFTELAVDAVLRLKGTGNLQSIQIMKRLGGNLEESFLDEGFLLDKKIGMNQPKRLENPKILVANTPMDTDKVKVFGSRVRVDAVSKVAELELAEKEKMKDKVDRICKHGCDVFINRQLIYNYPEQLFADKGVMAIEHADFEGVERLALVTGSEIVSTFDDPDRVHLGSCKLIEEIMIGEETVIKFSGVALGEACTIVIRGATQQIIDEAERSLHDALCVLVRTAADPKIIYGGGCTEMEMAVACQQEAIKTAGKESVAIEAFAKALMAMPSIIADNAGFDSAELVSQLRAAHSEGKKTWGLNVNDGCVGCMEEIGIIESLAVKQQVLMAATEAAEQLMRVDYILKAQPRPRQQDNHPC